MGEHDDLLRRFAPQLLYDSNEQYFADSAEQWTENPGNELRRADRDGRRGELLAAGPELTLALLAPGAYADGTEVRPGDHLSCPGGDYRRLYVALRTTRPELKNRIYGRAVEDNGRLWLQYWFQYFYNDYSLALGAGRHEGDWEMIQLRMHGEQPDVAVYAQHVHAEKRAWRDVERAPGKPDTPLVYVARGSHASYFRAGFHHTEVWYDVADGKRSSPELTLELLEGAAERWALWPGIWGDTRPRLPGGVHQPSPTGPGAKRQWSTPDALLESAISVEHRDAPEAPDVTVRRSTGRLTLEFDFERHDPPPLSLIVTVNSRDEAGVPPRTYTFALDDTISGRLDTRIAVDPDKHYDIYTSTTAGDPPVPSESTLDLLDPVGARHAGVSLPKRALLRIGELVAWVRGHLRRR